MAADSHLGAPALRGGDRETNQGPETGPGGPRKSQRDSAQPKHRPGCAAPGGM